jgi:hypothetical protein
MRNRRTLPSRQRTYRFLHVRVDGLEDAISHFYNVINELRRRVSTLEKKSKPLAKKKMSRLIESCWRVIEFLAQMPTDTKIFLTMAVLGLATMLIVLRLI